MKHDEKFNLRSYEDIIDLPHHVSGKHPHMSLHDRAAQFAPFAALTGYDDAIEETGRVTAARRELSDTEKAILDQKLGQLSLCMDQKPGITVCFFVPDPRKEGGAYQQVTGHLKRIHPYRKVLILEEGQEISLDDVISLEAELFLKERLD